ncbi:MAG: SHOCT domain-containing protein [Clostridia bacterium]|nr:SHOCT domain-containing protein [Clostridia bacterium]
MLFELNGTVSTLQVYEDRVLHVAKTTARSYIAGKFFNGTKEYFYDDLINVQFREATSRINGYLQFDYPGAVNISNSGFGGAGGNYNSENSFIFDINVRTGAAVLPGEDPVKAANRIVSDAYRYIHGRIMEEKKTKKSGYWQVEPAPQAASVADELKKYNELLQSGAITQEEYDGIKKKLL